MDTDILIGNKDCFCGEDFLDELTKDYQWSSLLDATDASPSEILADAAPVFLPPISPDLSSKSSPAESSNSDSGSEDDSKNLSSGTSERQSSQSPFDWLLSFDEEPTGNLNPEDVEQFLHKTEPIKSPTFDGVEWKESPERNGPVLSIENGVIKGVSTENGILPMEKVKIIQVTNTARPKKNGIRDYIFSRFMQRKSFNEYIKIGETKTVLETFTPLDKLSTRTRRDMNHALGLFQESGLMNSCLTPEQLPHTQINLQNYFKVENENNSTNSLKDNIVFNEQFRLVVGPKKIPSILKRPIVPKTSPIVIPTATESTKGGTITIQPLQQSKQSNGVKENGIHMKMSPPKNNIVINSNIIVSNATTPVQNIVIPKVELESPLSPLLPATELCNLSDAQIRALKKQQRMIKNRESACQSRQKRKDYVTALEQQLLEAHQEIARLRLENTLLRNQVDKVDNNGRGRKIPRLDTSFLKRTKLPKKNIAVIFAMIFMVSLNFNALGWNSKPFVGPSAPHHNRHLLWSEDSSPEVLSPDYDQPLNRSLYGCNTTKLNESYMNQTESIRIVGELNRWIGGGKTLNWTYDVPRRKRKIMNEEKINGGLFETYKLLNKLNIDSDLVDFPTANRKNVKEKSRLPRLRRSKSIDFPENDVYDYGLYPKPIRTSVNDFDLDFGEWKALLQALHRRDDTFYVFGVGKGEHLLLPAVSHNDTRPPKMALILPAKTGNDSLKSDHVTLMQIDCSVVNTTLVKLKSDKIPESLRTKPNEVKTVDKPEQKRSTYLRRPKPHINDPIEVLHSTSNNISNYPVKFKSSSQSNEIDDGKADLFSRYLIAKYEDSKNYTKTAAVENNSKSKTESLSRGGPT